MNTDLGSMNLGLNTPSTYSADPILEYLYDTAEQASNQARIWGFDGYRTYVINGATKYVPCTTAAEYQQATRLYTHQGAIVSQGKEVFGDKLVGYQFTETDNVKGDPIFTLGNFSIITSINQKQDIIYTLADAKRGYTGVDFTTEGIQALKKQILKSVTAQVKFDKTNLEKYVTYASLSERFRVTLQEIIETFPAAMRVIPYSITETSVYDYFPRNRGESATFKVRVANIQNPFGIIFSNAGVNEDVPEYVSPLRNFSKHFQKYEVYYKNKSYPIVGTVLPNSNNDPNGLMLIVQGDPFATEVITPSNTANVSFYIKPKMESVDDFYKNATDLAVYLLNPKSKPIYTATFNVPHRNDDGTFTVNARSKSFPMYDDFNIDVFNDPFDKYTTDIQFIADEFDRYKTDLIARFLTSDSLQEFDTPDRHTYATFQMYGAMFDNVKKYVDGISYMTNVSYDAIDNVPDVLLKNFAHMLGWKTYEIEHDDTLLESLFDVSTDRQGDDTPAEIDIELWRRIIINSFYLFKSKGTRKSIEFVLELVGIPLEIMDINEYVYVADQPLVLNTFQDISQSTLLNEHPIDIDGYPTTPPYIHFQANGGNMLNDGQNFGVYDNGQAYLDAFRQFGNESAFSLTRTIDNKKSWVSTSNEATQVYDFLLRDTNYRIKDSRLVINSKEAEASISSQMTLDYYVYSYYKKRNKSISVLGAKIEPSKLTFNEYLRDIIAKLIDPKNRKVVKVYPVLSNIYWEYLKAVKADGIESIDYKKTLQFINTFDTYWVKLLQQFVPATSIFTAGRKFANANITSSKFQYKHGLNKGKRWMGTDGSEFQSDALKPTPTGIVEIFQTKGSIRPNLRGNDIQFLYEANLPQKVLGHILRGEAFEAESDGFYRHYAIIRNILEEYHGNFGTMKNLVPNSPAIDPTATKMYTYITAGSTVEVGAVLTTSGDDVPYSGNFPRRYYSSYVTNNTINSLEDSVTITLEALPVEGDVNYPMQQLFLFGMEDVLVDTNEYYYAECDIRIDFPMKGNNVASYIALIPFFRRDGFGTNVPKDEVSDKFIMEGCLGEGDYEKYNWVHLKTKFKSTTVENKIRLMAKEVDYQGTGSIEVRNFTVTQISRGINFITPPPIPHVCYYDVDTVGADLLRRIPNQTDFRQNIWSAFGDILPTLSTVGDMMTVTIPANTDIAKFGGAINISGFIPPPPFSMYYYSITVTGIYSGNETLTYDMIPFIYLNLFNDSLDVSDTWKNIPIKIKPNHIEGTIKFEGFYHAQALTADTPRTTIYVQNNALLSSAYTITLSQFTLQLVDAIYTGEDGELCWYKQSRALGFSKNTNMVAPAKAIGGKPYNWVIPYILDGEVGDVGDISGSFDSYMNPTSVTNKLTTPLMHVNSTYLKKHVLDTNDSVIDINLTNTCGLGYQFFIPPNGCVTPRGATIDNQLFMSGMLDFTFDGFYPLISSTEAGLVL